MKHTSIKLNTPCEFLSFEPLNPLISKVQIKVCYVGDEPNRNKTVITREFAKKLAKSLPGSPIVGKYNREDKDFEEHNKMLTFDEDNGELVLTDDTIPYGFVSMDAKCWFQWYSDDGVEREYLVTEGYLWTGLYPECQRVIENGNNQSMELDKDHTSGVWANLNNSNSSFFILNESIISKLCILGEDYEPCFEGAQIGKLEFSFEDDFKNRLFSMMNELKELIKGGNPMLENEEVIAETETIVEEAAESEVQTEEVAEQPVAEETADIVVETVTEEITEEAPAEFIEAATEEESEDETVKYNLDEIPEYIELRNNYSALETSYNELKEANASLTSTLGELTEFKKSVEKKDKLNLIKSFYMLSEEDKKDVVDNIDQYSLDDIEAKLSILCVRNKVSFALDTEEENVNYSLNINGLEDDCTPAWVKAIQSVAKKNN